MKGLGWDKDEYAELDQELKGTLPNRATHPPPACLSTATGPSQPARMPCTGQAL